MFRRIWNLLLGRANKALDSIENPEDRLNMFVREMEGRIQDTNSSLARAIADEKRLKLQIEDHLAKSKDWESRAMLAVREGRDDLAKEALMKKEDHEAIARETGTHWEQQKQAVEKLKVSLHEIKQRVDKEKREYNLLLAKYNTAKSKKAISDTITAVGNNNSRVAPSLVEDLKNRIHQLEASAEAQLELADNRGSSDLESEFAKLESKRNGDESLKALKAKMEEQHLLGASANVDKVEELKRKLQQQ